MPQTPADILFSPAVRTIQKRYGSREYIARLEQRNYWQSRLDEEVISFIQSRQSFYLGTASHDGRPYIQHRGGPPGFVQVLDEQTLAWPEFRGNRQYITAGNLSENNQAFIFFMDYSLPRRIKLWGRAEVVEHDDALLRVLSQQSAGKQLLRAIRFSVEAWDENCRNHIPAYRPDTQYSNDDMQGRDKIAALEKEVLRLRSQLQRITDKT